MAYTVGDLQENSANYKFVYPNTLFLLNTETNQQTEIFSLDVTTELEYVHRLVDLAFSRDGKQLAFSTTNNVYLHSLETNTTESLFGATTSKQVKNTAGSPIYGYSGMSFSPTDTHLYVRRGFYEGMEPVVVSMETKAEVSVPLADELGGYGGYILDWYDENSLVAVKDLDAEPGFSTTALLQLSILDQNFKQIATVHQNHALYGGYQMGALQLFAVPYTLQEGEETSEILWLTVDAQEPSGLKQIASFKNEPGVGAEMFEMLDENIVLLQAFDPSLSYGKLYTFNKATNKLQLVADDARLSNWK